MSSMKDYCNAVDRMEISDAVGQALLTETKPARRIIRHSRLGTSVAAAAVAGVIGLNVFAFVKLRETAAQKDPAGSSPTEPALSLPDLSEFGIDTDGFTRSDEPASVLPDGEWFYNVMPQYTWTEYRNADNDAIYLNENGKLVQYKRDASNVSPYGDPIGEDAAYRRVLDLVNTVTSLGTVTDSSRDEPDYADAAEQERFYYSYQLKLQWSDTGEFDTAWVALSHDGTVQVCHVNYDSCKPTDPNSYRREAAQLAALFYGGSTEYREVYYRQIGDQIYGLYMITDKATGAENAVLVRKPPELPYLLEFGIDTLAFSAELQKDEHGTLQYLFTNALGSTILTDTDGSPLLYQASEREIDAVLEEKDSVISPGDREGIMYGFAFGFSEFDAEYGELTHTQVLEYGDWTAHSYTLTMHGDHIKTVYITVLDNGMVIYCKVA